MSEAIATAIANPYALLAVLCIGASIWFFIQDRFPMLLVSFGIIAGLFVIFSVIPTWIHGADIVSPEDILSGFGNKALLAIMALLVVGQGLYITGAVAGPSNWLLKHHNTHPKMVLLATFGFIFAVSAFINNTPVVIIFLPILSAMAQQANQDSSRLLMPLSFVTILAGMTTLIGTSTNLLAVEAYELALVGVEAEFVSKSKILFFDQTRYGIVLALIGLAFILLCGRFLLPKRAGLTATVLDKPLTQFIAQFDVPSGSKLIGLKTESGRIGDLGDTKIRLIQRGETAIIPPFRGTTLQAGDRVVIAAPRSRLGDLLKKYPEILHSSWQSQTDRDPQDTDTKPPQSLELIEAIIAPGSRISDLSLGLVGFSANRNLLTLGIQRRKGMVRAALSEIRLQAGDTLLLVGTPEAFEQLREDRDLILMESTKKYLPTTKKANLAIGITAAMILVAAMNWVDISIAAFLAAASMVMSGCLNPRQASRALDLDIYVIVAAALALGTVLMQTGASEIIAEGLLYVTLPYGPYAVLSAVFLLVAIFTNLLSNAATAVIFTPLAVSAALSLGVDPFPFLIAVILGSNCCFATPIAYQTNLLVMGPAHYEFKDFIRFGGPLTLLLWLSFTALSPLFFQF